MDIATIETVLLSLLVADALALTGLVLVQQGKGADVGAAFGSGSSNTMFGSSGSTSFLTKATAWLAIGFFFIAFGLAYIAKEKADTAGTIGIPTVREATQDTGGDQSLGIDDLPEVLTDPLEGVDSSLESDGSSNQLDDVPSDPSPLDDIPEL